MVRNLIFKGNFLFTDYADACSKAQARRILSGKAKRYIQNVTPDRRKDSGWDYSIIPVKRSGGVIKIGCMTFSAAQVRAVRNWLAGKKAREWKG